MKITLYPILVDGTVKDISIENEYFASVIPQTISNYKKVGFLPPWISYVVFLEDEPVGMGAYKSPPVDARVEIAYFTFPPFENKGIGTKTVKELIRIAKERDPVVVVFAQTLPEKNASTSILTKLNFIKTRDVVHPEDGNVWEWELRS